MKHDNAESKIWIKGKWSYRRNNWLDNVDTTTIEEALNMKPEKLS